MVTSGEIQGNGRQTTPAVALSGLINVVPMSCLSSTAMPAVLAKWNGRKHGVRYSGSGADDGRNHTGWTHNARVQDTQLEKGNSSIWLGVIFMMTSWPGSAYSELLALCEGNPPVTGGFLSQRASNAGRWCLLSCPHEHTLELPMITEAITLLWRHEIGLSST